MSASSETSATGSSQADARPAGRMRAAVGAIAATVLIGAWSSIASGADVSLATLEPTRGKGQPRVVRIDQAQALASLEAELSSLPPSKRGFPGWLVHLWSGSERIRSFAVFPEDLPDHPMTAKAVDLLGREQTEFMYHLRLPNAYSDRTAEVVSKLEAAGFRPLLHAGEHSNWPYVEVVVGSGGAFGLKSVEAPAEIDPADRAAFDARIGAVLVNKARDRELEPLFQNLRDRLYRLHLAFKSDPEIRQFRADYRRYRWKGPNGPKLSMVVRYAAPDAEYVSRIESRLGDLGESVRPQRASGPFGIELLTDESQVAVVRERLATSFPDLLAVKPGRPLY
jgi:hypothetical protein